MDNSSFSLCFVVHLLRWENASPLSILRSLVAFSNNNNDDDNKTRSHFSGEAWPCPITLTFKQRKTISPNMNICISWWDYQCDLIMLETCLNVKLPLTKHVRDSLNVKIGVKLWKPKTELYIMKTDCCCTPSFHAVWTYDFIDKRLGYRNYYKSIFKMWSLSIVILGKCNYWQCLFFI